MCASVDNPTRGKFSNGTFKAKQLIKKMFLEKERQFEKKEFCLGISLYS